MQGAGEGEREKERNETSSVEESESAVGRNVQKGVEGESLKSEARESVMREAKERKQVGAQYL